MVFNLTGSELVVILLLALVVLGPEKLPGAIRQVGRVYRELRRISTGFQKEFTSAFTEPAQEIRNLTDMLGSSLEDLTSPAPETPPPPATSTTPDSEPDNGESTDLNTESLPEPSAAEGETPDP